MYKEPWDWKYIGLYVERAHQLPSPFRLPGHWQFLDILETALETSSLFCTPEHSSHDWSSLFQLTPKQCGGRPHVIPNQLNTAPALCTLHPHSVGDAFLCGGAEEWNFSCIEHEIKKEEARTSDNTLCEAAVSDLELTLLSLTATICSSSSPSASPCHCSTLSWLFFSFFLFLGIPTLCFTHLSTRQSFPRLLPMSLGRCWSGLLQSTTIHPNSFHCPWECWNSSCPTTTTQLFLELELPTFCKISACLSSLFSLCNFLASYWLTSYIWKPPGSLVCFESSL